MEIFVVLHDIRSAHNVGSFFRTADGAGVSKLFLCGYTPAPIDRFGRTVHEIEKTSLGATGTIPWERFADTRTCLEYLRDEGVEVVVVEQCERAVAYDTARYKNKVAFVFGNEREGVPEELRNEADMVVSIPMHGTKESLNVSVSAGIVLFDALRESRTLL